MRVALVSCVGLKRSSIAQAKDLYISDWFKKARSYAERTCDRWYILSAEYHAVHPATPLLPYNKSLNTMTQQQRRSWADEVACYLYLLIHPSDEIVVLAGRHYREYLIPQFDGRNTITIPMAGLGIGQQLKWLKEHTP